MEDSTKGIVAAGAAAALAAIYLYRDKIWPMVKAIAPSEPKRMGAASPTNAASHKAARPIVREALIKLLGREPTPAELQYGQAIGWLETNYGKGWKGPMVGSNNWGAVQCAAGSTLPCISYEDSRADGTKYTVSFRKYDSPVDGAADMLRHIFKLRPITAGALASSRPTVFKASYAMRRERYYEGFCPKATKQFGSAAVRASLANPDKDDATRACAREATTAHAERADSIIAQIAGSLGEFMDMPLGTYEDAADYYRSARPAVSGPAELLRPPHGPVPRSLLEVVP